MVNVGGYYRVDTPYGTRTVLCTEIMSGDLPYGIYSPSNYLVSLDNQGIVIPENSDEATPIEARMFNDWYNDN